MLILQLATLHLYLDNKLDYLLKVKINMLLLLNTLQTLTPTCWRNLLYVYEFAHNLGSVSHLSLVKPSVPSAKYLDPIWWNCLPYKIHGIPTADAFNASPMHFIWDLYLFCSLHYVFLFLLMLLLCKGQEDTENVYT